MEKAEQWS